MTQLDTIVCANHPKIAADTKCEICGKPLCIACKEVYHDTRGVGDSRYNKRMEVCRECKVQRVSAKSKALKIGIPLMVVIAIISGITLLTLWNIWSQPPNFPNFP